ncbi:MAG TPA: PKD domain-containing protein, partial [Thermoanaerobaculia bacterium]|nr:PKD domain-containing protein [Thermoanaerobaculia bacterium]
DLNGTSRRDHLVPERSSFMGARLRVLAASAAALAALVARPALSADVIVPSSAFSTGINAEFHSDVRVFNPTNSPVDFTPIFYRSDAGGNVVATVPMPVVTIGPRQQLSYDNVLQSLFGQSLGAFGPIRFQTAGTLLVSSGVNNVNACGTAGSRSGQGLTGIDVSQALKTGTLVQLAASADPATGYRSNLDFMNPGATAANVAVTIHRGDGTHLDHAVLSVGPNGLVQKKIDDSGVFPGVAGTTDTNLWMEFTSDQPVLAFASVINNGSGDPFAVMMTPEPSAAPAGPLEPVAQFTVSPNALAGYDVIFTDTSTNSPAYRFWSFGDGEYDTSGARVVHHAYAAAGAFKAGLVVSNAGGSTFMFAQVDVTPYTMPGY